MSGTWQLEHESRLASVYEALLDDGVEVTSRFETPGESAPGSRLALFTAPGLVAIFAVFAAAVWTDQGLLALLCGLMLATAGLARAWAALSLLGLDYRRHLSSSCAFPGDTVMLSLTLDNRKPLPLGWAGADERIPRAIAPADRPVDPAGHLLYGRIGFGTPLGWYQSATWTCPLLCRRRGYYPFGTGRLMAGDIFGLYLRGRNTRARLAVTVYPALYSLAELGLPSKHPLGDARDPLLLFDDASRPSGLRDYSADTPFKNIAWAASARHSQLYAKTFEQTVTLKTIVCLAVDRFDETRDRTVFELGVSTAASVANHLIEQRQPVGLFVNGELADGAGPVLLGAGRGDLQLRSILESLAKLRRATAVPLPQLLEAQAASLTAGTTLCVIAARLSAADIDQLVVLRRHGCGVLGLIVGSAALPDALIPLRRIGSSDLLSRPT